MTEKETEFKDTVRGRCAEIQNLINEAKGFSDSVLLDDLRSLAESIMEECAEMYPE